MLPAGPVVVPHAEPGLSLLILPRRSKAEWLAGGFHNYEVEEVACARQWLRPADTVFDVGAHIGFYATLFSRLAPSGRVVAFEPDPANLELLRRNLDRNRAANVTLVARAVSETSGIRKFAIDGATGSSGTLEFDLAYGSRLEGAAQGFRSVTTMTLDQAGEEFGAADFVKIDVEGHELPVLRGAGRLLANARLRALIVEVSNDAARPAVFELLKRHGFTLVDIRSGQEREGIYGSLLAVRQSPGGDG